MFHSKTKHTHILKFCNRKLKYENKIVKFKMMHSNIPNIFVTQNWLFRCSVTSPPQLHGDIPTFVM